MVTDGDLGARIVIVTVTGAYVRKQDKNKTRGKREKGQEFICYNPPPPSVPHTHTFLFYFYIPSNLDYTMRLAVSFIKKNSICTHLCMCSRLANTITP